MQRAGGHFLAGAGFAGDQHGGAAGADHADDVAHVAHPQALSDQKAFPVFSGGITGQARQALQDAGLHGLFDQRHGLFRGGQQLVGPETGQTHRVGDGPPGGRESGREPPRPAGGSFPARRRGSIPAGEIQHQGIVPSKPQPLECRGRERQSIFQSRRGHSAGHPGGSPIHSTRRASMADRGQSAEGVNLLLVSGKPHDRRVRHGISG